MARKKNSSSGQEWTAEWFSENSIDVGDALRELHENAPAKRVKFLARVIEFIEDKPPEDDWDDLCEGGLPEALIDIAVERELYRQFPTNKTVAVSTFATRTIPV